jgi:hypothetical protein
MRLQAIRWATEECAADIVSMSFGFVREHRAAPISTAINDVLHVQKRKTIFLASANNKGATERETFPASHKDVIAIRSTNTLGGFEDTNAPKSSRDGFALGTLGVNVPGAGLPPDLECLETGSSVATAIAAGMAGVLLAYVESRAGESEQEAVKDRITTQEGMSDLFKRLGSMTKPDHYYFGLQTLRGDSGAMRWSYFLEVVRSM